MVYQAKKVDIELIEIPRESIEISLDPLEFIELIEKSKSPWSIQRFIE